MRVLTEGGETSLFPTGDSLYAVVDTEDLRSIAFATDDGSVVGDVYTVYRERFDDAETFDLRTPGRTRAMERLATDVSEDVRENWLERGQRLSADATTRTTGVNATGSTAGAERTHQALATGHGRESRPFNGVVGSA